MVRVSPLVHTKQARLFFPWAGAAGLKEKPPDPACHPAAALSEADSRYSGAVCQAPSCSPHPQGRPPQQLTAPPLHSLEQDSWCGTQMEVDDVDCDPRHHVGSLNTACEARREAQPAVHALGNCRFCPPGRQDARCPIPPPTWAQPWGVSCQWPHPSPGHPVCVQSPALHRASRPRPWLTTCHPRFILIYIQSDPMSFWSGHLPGTGQSI